MGEWVSEQASDDRRARDGDRRDGESEREGESGMELAHARMCGREEE